MSFFFGGPGGFPGMGGMPGGMPGMGGDDDSDGGESSNNTKYYECLGIDKSATPQQIKKSYRKLAREVHPDKHPDEAEKYHEKFQELQKAYEVLSDPEKKKLYDRYGEAGLKGASSGFGGGGADIFDMFFGGGGHGHGHRGGGGRGQQRRRKAPPIQQFLDVTLEDLYLGSSRVISYEKMTICSDCDGKGGKKVTECGACHGNGVQVIMKQMGYMTVQTQRECPHCNGEGTSIPESAKCKKCEGKGMKKVAKKLDFIIPRGSKHAEKVTVPDFIALQLDGHPTTNDVDKDTLRFSFVVPPKIARDTLYVHAQLEVSLTGARRRLLRKVVPKQAMANQMSHFMGSFGVRQNPKPNHQPPPSQPQPQPFVPSVGGHGTHLLTLQSPWIVVVAVVVAAALVFNLVLLGYANCCGNRRGRTSDRAVSKESEFEDSEVNAPMNVVSEWS